MVLFMFFCLIFEFIMILLFNHSFNRLLEMYNWIKDRNDLLEREKNKNV